MREGWPPKFQRNWGAPMTKRKSPRELAARALCKLDGNTPDATMDGEPLWQSYLPEVDATLKEALSEEEWQMLRDDG